ncbi:MAG: fumarylacetoacetate hydrolase family protein [Sphingomonadaceae bacterium]|nr:fumarylacetoacetate hydrolase family protein [Sphingomonadaceae bacterium]
MTDRDRAARFADARRTGEELADAEPLELDRGYAIADQLAENMPQVVGWKVGATSPAGQSFLGISEPIWGRVFDGGLWTAPADVDLHGDRPAEAEPEIFVRIGTTPDGELRPVDIAALHLGIELNRPSRPDALTLGAGFIVADNAANVGLVIGDAFPTSALATPTDVTVRLLRNGELVSTGDAAAVLGDPLEAARWLVRKRACSERPVRAGDWIATGAMARSATFAIGDEVIADFGALGTLRVGRVPSSRSYDR